MKVRIASFNIYWFPSSSFIGNHRSQEDLDKLREVIRRLDADVIVFQEIVDLAALEGLLSGLTPNREYQLRDAAGNWIASGAAKKGDQKVSLVFDSRTLELLEGGTALRAGDPPASKGRRDPVAARLRPRGGGPAFTVIGVHLKSGLLTEGPTPSTPDDQIRIEETEKLTAWITQLAPLTPGGPQRPAGEPTVLVGDFNAVDGNVAFKPFSAAGPLASWSQPAPRFTTKMLPSPTEANLSPNDRWTTHLDKKVIDHILVAPGTKVADGPWVYAFDRDDSWLKAVGVTGQWLEAQDYLLSPANGPAKKVENLHHISDHRPVWVDVALG